MGDFFLIFLYAIGLRWFVFSYKRTTFFRDWLRSFGFAWIDEILDCCYCQTIECSVFVQCAIGHFDIAAIVFGSLANGWIAIAIDHFHDRCVSMMEAEATQ